MHARPAADRRHRPLGLRPARARLRVPARAGVRERRARRRDQPRDAEDAVGAARGDGRAAGDDRRRHAARCPSRSSCSRPRTRSSRRARSRSPRRSSTASSCARRSATRARTTSSRSSRSSCACIRSRRCGPVARRSTTCSALRDAVAGRLHRPGAPPLGRSGSSARRARRDGVAIGASVRGSLALERAARAWALLDGRDYVTPVDVERLFLPVVMHRIVFTPSFVADGARDRLGRRPRSASASSASTLAPPPGRGAGRAGRRCGRVDARPSRSSRGAGCSGSPSAALHSLRRGLGSDVAGSRPYEPGDDIDKIDWYASARLSLARGSEEFVVREHFAEEAPRVVVLCDRRPSMALFARRLAVAAQAGGDPARGAADRRQRRRRARPARLPRRGRRRAVLAAAAQRGASSAQLDVERPVRRAGGHARARARATSSSTGATCRPGTFVFVLSDFLAHARRATTGCGRSSAAGRSSRS